MREYFDISYSNASMHLSFNCVFSVPTGVPDNFSATADTSTSIEASWKLPPRDSWNGIIVGFRLFYQKSGSGTSTMLTIQNQGTLAKNVTGLEKYTLYEFQVLAYTSVGDGPSSSTIVERTKEDVKIYLV